MINIKNKFNLGFTLVELLIVIALLGVLAAAVLAAINPLEQANRARDAKYKSDASQLLAAIDRYFVSKDEFPWMTVTPLTYDSADDAIGFMSARDENIGVCTGTCIGDTGSGELITNNELKTEFQKRDFITKTGALDLLYIGKVSGASESIYACYVPRSKSERSKATQSLAVGSPILTPVTDCATRAYTGLDTSCVTCLPQ